MSNVIDFLMKTKKSDGTYDILHPITKTSNVKTSEEIPVMLNNAVGSFENGDTISAGTSIDVIVRKLVQERIPPIYTQPTVSIAVTSGTTGGYYEEGTVVTPTITATFTKNDAGSLTNIVIKKNDIEAKSATASPTSHTEELTVVGTNTFSATATYAAGLIKKDNFEEDYPSGSINAGSKSTVNNITYTGYRKYFWGSDTVTTPAVSSANIRALSNSSENAAAPGTSFTISVSRGQTRATFAYPANIRDVTSVKYVEMGNDESDMLFAKTVVPVEGANGFTAIDYKVYTLIPAQPFPSDMTFNVTI